MRGCSTGMGANVGEVNCVLDMVLKYTLWM